MSKLYVIRKIDNGEFVANSRYTTTNIAMARLYDRNDMAVDKKIYEILEVEIKIVVDK